jgi:aspartokinase-like uncharacterized kinase
LARNTAVERLPLVLQVQLIQSTRCCSDLGTDVNCDLVVKIGGGLLAQAGRLDAVLAEIALVRQGGPLLVVPGGGPFADAVREVDRRIRLSDDAAHWMAVLAMDQYAHLINSRLAGGVVVSGPDEIASALDAGGIPVLAPYQWLRDVDPLPHCWEVTSDSIAAWVAGQLDAGRLVLVKPAGADGGDLVDAYFRQVLPGGIEWEIVPADRIETWAAALRAPTRALNEP